MSKEEIRKWCHENLFGNREIPGLEEEIPLTPTQLTMLNIAVDIIEKWEARTHETKV